MERPVSLYLVATPIGNRGDLSERAKQILASVDFIAAEDTRTSGVLLTGYGIKKPMVSYFDHNRRAHGTMILSRLEAGETCALITDAGMPAVSDPGQELVAECREKGLRVSAIPGPCAFVTALAMSGLPSRRFSFEGFLPQENKPRRALLDELKNDPRTLLFYEAPHRLLATLEEFARVFGEDRRICCVREITKMYEDSVLCTVEQAVEHFRLTPPRGEFVLVLEGAAPVSETPGREEIVARYRSMSAVMPKSAAAKEIARLYGMSKRDVYEQIKDLDEA